MSEYTLTGLQRTYLESVRERISPDDGPAHELAGDLDADGMIRFRPATMGDQLDRLIAQWLWEQTVEGEVRADD